MDLEGFMLREISWTEKDKSMTSLICGTKRYNKLVNITKKKQTHRHREQTSGYTEERSGGRGKIGQRD